MSWNIFRNWLGGGRSLVELAVLDTLRRLLQSLPVEWREEAKGQDGSETEFVFTFQNGHFFIRAEEGYSFARIFFLNFNDAPFGQLDNVRFACNEFNQRYSDFKAIYSIDEEEHTIGMHLQSIFRLSTFEERLKTDLAGLLSMFFEAARAYREMLDQIVSNDNTNLEESNAMHNREVYLAFESEIKSQTEPLQWRSNEVEHHTLGQLFRTLLGVEEINFQRLRLIVDEVSTVTDAETIETTDLLEPIIQSQPDGTALFVAENATLLVDASTPLHPMQQFAIHLHAEAETDECLYVRITFLPTAKGLSPDQSHRFTNRYAEQPFSFVMAYEVRSAEERQEEFNYIWKELQQAIRDEQKLSDTQQFVAMCHWPNVGYNLYWGRRFYESRRYYEALQHLENAYDALNHHYATLSDAQKERLVKLAYYIGGCYTELGLYRQAYYYLDTSNGHTNTMYWMQYVNSLVRAHDFRAMLLIQNLLAKVERDLANAKEEESAEGFDTIHTFHQYLLRQKATVFINDGAFDEAEQLLQSMLAEGKQESAVLRLLTLLKDRRDQHTKEL